jgi:Domain of unknown function (DUF1735)
MNIIFKMSIGMALTLSLASCLKDKDYDSDKVGLDLSDAPKVVDLTLSSNSTAKSQVLGINAVNQVVDVPIATVRLAAAEVASEDITVTIDTTSSSSIISSYNTTNSTNVLKMPNAFHSFPNGMKVVIAKGTREAKIMIKTNANDLGLVNSYGIGFKIASISNAGYTISSNFNSFLGVVAVKNAYDGIYECDFKNYHPTLNSAYTGAVTEVEFRTTSATACKIYWPDAGAFANPAVLSGALNYFGSQEPEYTFNAVTNAVTVQNAFPGAVTFYTMNPTHPNNYDPANKIINVRWGYGYVGGNFTLGTSREWTQKLTYLRPR